MTGLLDTATVLERPGTVNHMPDHVSPEVDAHSSQNAGFSELLAAYQGQRPVQLWHLQIALPKPRQDQ
ncbi:MAG: hypothetical protein PsegKO_19590 [Pseudohongiellaceae bacterium]